LLGTTPLASFLGSLPLLSQEGSGFFTVFVFLTFSALPTSNNLATRGFMSFDLFIGNTAVMSRLRTKLRENRFPHAVIFAGPQGVGKHTLALMITKALNCPVKGPADFCDECPQCRKINSGVHPDVLSVTVE